MEMATQYQKQLTNCCCLTFGIYKILARLEEDIFFVNDCCFVTIEVDSSMAQCNIKHIKCQLIQNIILKPTNLRDAQTIRRVISTVDLPRVAKGEKKIGKDAFRIKLSTSINQNSLQGSTRGNLVRSEFQLEVTTELDASLYCQDHPRVTVDMKLYNQDPEIDPVFPVYKWNPQTMPVYICPIGPDSAWKPEMKSLIYN